MFETSHGKLLHRCPTYQYIKYNSVCYNELFVGNSDLEINRPCGWSLLWELRGHQFDEGGQARDKEAEVNGHLRDLTNKPCV